MPDQSVEVTFDPNANPQFTFRPETVTMTKAGKIVLHRRPQDAPWKFLSARVDDSAPGQFSSTVHGNGSLLHIHDEFTDEWRRFHKYTVTVRFDWGDYYRIYESPDPVIVNDPGSRDVALAEEQKGGKRRRDK